MKKIFQNKIENIEILQEHLQQKMKNLKRNYNDLERKKVKLKDQILKIESNSKEKQNLSSDSLNSRDLLKFAEDTGRGDLFK